MTKVIIHDEKKVTYVAPQYVAKKKAIAKHQGKKLTDADIIEDVAKNIAGDDFDVVLESSLPDPYFRDAWRRNGGKMIINLSAARELHMDKIRKKRDEKLAFLDVETLKGNDVQAEKQVLRDLPENFDLSSAKTPEEIKALWPVELEG